MCEPTTIMMGISLAMTAVSGVMQAQSQKAQGKAAQGAADYRAAVNRNNAISADYQATDAILRGRLESDAIGIKGAQFRSKQIVAAGGSGVDVASGSVINQLDDTAGMVKLDILTAAHNAEMEALGFKNQSNNFLSEATLNSYEGANARAAGNARAASTLVSTAGSVAGKWASFGGFGSSGSSYTAGIRTGSRGAALPGGGTVGSGRLVGGV